MDLLTHAFASLAAARAGQKWLPRYGAAIVVVAGVAPDLDFASYWGGAEDFLRFHRGALHGFAGASLTACAVAGAACAVCKEFSSKQNSPALRFSPALAAAILGVFTHLALDFFSGPGVMFLWPLRMRWWGCEIVRDFDPWVLVLLVAGILLPELFRLVSEEIGERGGARRGSISAIVTLALLAGYLGYRAELRSRAISILMSSEFHGRAPTSAGAFPFSGNPFEWRGVVSTETTLEEVNVPAGHEGDFDPDRSLTFYKPPDSPVLAAAEKTRAAKRFLVYARFPLAEVEKIDDGFVVEFRDLRFSRSETSSDNIIAFVEFDSALQIRSQGIRFASGQSR